MSRVTRCARCTRRLRNDNDRWYALGFGPDAGHVCPGCQTEEQRSLVEEMQSVYGVLDRGGVVVLPEGTVVRGAS
jgi:hypothetical protein